MVFPGHVAWAAAVVLVWLVFLFDACSVISRIYPLLCEPKAKDTPKNRLLRKIKNIVKNEIHMGLACE